jgi:protein TonB
MGDIALNGSTVLIGIAIIFILVVGLIFSFRTRFSKLDREHLKETEGIWDLTSRTKYPQANAFKYSGTLLGLGVALSLLATILAFSWTTYEEVIDVSAYDLEIEEDIEIEPPRTAEPPPPPPPPPPPVIEEVPEEEIEEEEEIEFEDMTVEEETVIEAPPPPEPKKEAPPPPPPPPPPSEPEIFKVVEEMPRFPGCEHLGSKAEKQKCHQEKLLQFVYKNIKYPAIARENGVEGQVVVRFVVDEKGKVGKAEILRDIGAGCGKEALRVVELMNGMAQTWIPGKQRGRPVKVWFNLPVKFKLE